MNKKRKEELDDIISGMQGLRDRLQDVADDEQEAFDNMPENLQCSERCEQMEQNASDLYDVVDDFDRVIEAIEDILDSN